MNILKIGLTTVSALSLLLCGTMVNVSAKNISQIILAQNDKSQINPQLLVAEALQIIEKNYIDGNFNGLNWQQVKTQTLNSQYATSEQAYQAIDSILNRLDNPATRLLTAKQFAGFSAENSGKNIIGVGLPETLSLDYDEQRYLRIITPLPNSLAAKAGLTTGDFLTAINGLSTDNLSLAAASKKLRGAKGSTVNLTLKREDSTFDVQLKREKIIVVPTVRTKLINVGKDRIGYIYLSQFLDSSPSEIRKALDKLKEAKALILDLRNNPGGSVLTAVELAGFFLGEAKIGTAATRVNLPPLKSTEIQLTRQPLIVLVNQGTASAAELLAGSLQDWQRAIVVGTPTIGKGLIHNIEPLADNSAIVVTLGKLFTPNGRDILKSGIEPDVFSDSDNSPLLDPNIEPASSKDIQYLKAIEQLQKEFY